MHILLIHQAFASLDEPGGTRHHELARYLASQGHKVTIIASPISYLTGKARSTKIPWSEKQTDGDLITIIRAYTYPSLHRSFTFRLISFFSFMVSSFIIGLGVKNVDLVWGTSPPIFQGLTAWLLARIKRHPISLRSPRSLACICSCCWCAEKSPIDQALRMARDFSLPSSGSGCG